MNEYPGQNCVLVGSSIHQEILPASLCWVLPGQYFSLPAGKGWLKCPAEHTGKYVSGMDGDFTKLLKCAMSPSVADNFHLKIPGYGQYSALRANRFDRNDRVVEGKLIERHISAIKKEPNFEPQVLLLVFASDDVESLKDLVVEGFTTHAGLLKERLSAAYAQGFDESGISKLIADAWKNLPKSRSSAAHEKVAIVGIFRKPWGLGTPSSFTAQTPSGRLRRTYEALKLQCHKEGLHFAGTLLHHDTKLQDDNNMKTMVLNTVHRLKTQRESTIAIVSKTPPATFDGRHRTLLLGVYVSELSASALEQMGESDGNLDEAPKVSTYRWYVVSITAK
jgi:hypothetical protein